MTPNPYDVMFLGLSFDIAGGIALASGFMLKGLNDVFRESRSTYGYNRALLKGALQQRADAWAGAALLAFGFLLQMYAYFHGGLTTKSFGYVDRGSRLVGLLAFGVAPLALVLVWVSRRVSLRSLARFEDALRNPEATPIVPIPGDPGHLDTVARELGASRLGTEETDEEMAARLTAIRAEDAARAREKKGNSK